MISTFTVFFSLLGPLEGGCGRSEFSVRSFFRFKCWCDRVYSFSVLTYFNHMIYFLSQHKFAVMPTYLRVCKYSLLLHFFIFIAIHTHVIHTFSTLTLLQESEYLAYKTNLPGKVIFPGKSVQGLLLMLCICYLA